MTSFFGGESGVAEITGENQTDRFGVADVADGQVNALTGSWGRRPDGKYGRSHAPPREVSDQERSDPLRTWGFLGESVTFLKNLSLSSCVLLGTEPTFSFFRN